MNYLDYKRISKEVLATKNGDAIAYFMDIGSKVIGGRLKNYRYTHSDLTKDEYIRLMRMNNLNDDDILCGGDVQRVLGDVSLKEDVIATAQEIELFHILDMINWIINQREDD